MSSRRWGSLPREYEIRFCSPAVFYFYAARWFYWRSACLTYYAEHVNTSTDGESARNLRSHKDLAIAIMRLGWEKIGARTPARATFWARTRSDIGDESFAELLCAYINRVELLERSSIAAEESRQRYASLLHAVKLAQHMALDCYY